MTNYPGIVSDISSESMSSIYIYIYIYHIYSDSVSDILSGNLSGIVFGIYSGIVSGIRSGILSDIFSGICSGLLSGILSDIISDILSGLLFGILSCICIFWHPSLAFFLVCVRIHACTANAVSVSWDHFAVGKNNFSGEFPANHLWFAQVIYLMWAKQSYTIPPSSPFL